MKSLASTMKECSSEQLVDLCLNSLSATEALFMSCHPLPKSSVLTIAGASLEHAALVLRSPLVQRSPRCLSAYFGKDPQSIEVFPSDFPSNPSASGLTNIQNQELLYEIDVLLDLMDTREFYSGPVNIKPPLDRKQKQQLLSAIVEFGLEYAVLVFQHAWRAFGGYAMMKYVLFAHV